MSDKKTLPPGQKASEIFPRFGLPQYADRFPTDPNIIRFSVGGEIEEFEISEQLKSLSRIDQVSDFHCVTTWSALNLNWSGYRFSDFYNTLILPHVEADISFVILKAQDGYKTSLPLADLMHENVLLADQLYDKPLSIEHGAPLRIIAPDHYGYKNLKHLKRLEFYSEIKSVKQGYLSFMDHPRARVAKEERATKGPGILFRYLYRLGIKGTIKKFNQEMLVYKNEKSE